LILVSFQSCEVVEHLALAKG